MISKNCGGVCCSTSSNIDTSLICNFHEDKSSSKCFTLICEDDYCIIVKWR